MTENLNESNKKDEYKPKKLNHESITLSSEKLKSILNRLQKEELQNCIGDLVSYMQELNELDENSRKALEELIDGIKIDNNRTGIKLTATINPKTKSKRQGCVLL